MDKLARAGNPEAIAFPRGLLDRDILDFSFSGMKTAAAQYIKKQVPEKLDAMINDIAASFQEAVVDVLVKKTIKAAMEKNVSTVVISGGVACNSRLREKMKEEGDNKGVEVFFPSPILCSDNAAMIAALGHYYINKKKENDLSMNAVARWQI